MMRVLIDVWKRVELRNLPSLAGLGAMGIFLFAVLAGCGTDVPDLDDAWRELRDPARTTSVSTVDRRLLLARMVLEESTLPSGARARFPLGFAHLVEHLSEQPGDASLYRDFDRLTHAIAAGRDVRADIRLDVARVEAGSRVALEQSVEMQTTGTSKSAPRSLWLPAQAPGFPKPLAANDVRVDVARPGGWSRVAVEPVRLAGVGPEGFAAQLPEGADRLRVIYGGGVGFWMPQRAGTHELPLWFGVDSDVVFLVGASPLDVIPAVPSKVDVHGPSVVRPGEVFALELRRADRFGNEVDESVRPAMDLWSDGRVERRFPSGPSTRLTVDGLSRAEGGVVRYRVESADGLMGWSAPILVREHGPKLLWGDPASPSDSCLDESSRLDFRGCVAWGGCFVMGFGEGRCSMAGDAGVLWMDRVRRGASMRVPADWSAGLERFGVADRDRGTMALASLELLMSGSVLTSPDVADPGVAILGTSAGLGGLWPGSQTSARPPVTAAWSIEEVGAEARPQAHRFYATSGPRIVIDCRAPNATTESARCAVHGTAPLWRVEVLLPNEQAADALSTEASVQTWRLVEGRYPLETRDRTLLLATWSLDAEGPRGPTYSEVDLSTAGGAIPAVSLFGDALETSVLGRDGVLARQISPPTRGGFMADLGGAVAPSRRLRLVLRTTKREEVVDFLAREAPFRRPLEAGWIETDWVAERPVLDLDTSFPELDPADVSRALVLVQQVDGAVAIARFRPDSRVP